MKKIIILGLITSLFVGCQPINQQDQTLATSQTNPIIETTNQEELASQPEEPVVIDNDGGNFTKDDLIYFIMTDRFADGTASSNLPDTEPGNPHKFQGGDIKGITNHLDYIQGLGATAIWLTPIMTNGTDGYHGYWIHDFYSVDPHFGTMDDFKELVAEAHKRDMKVILDYIVNHTGYNSPWLEDPIRSTWFHEKRDINNWTDPVLIENGWLAGLPDLDQDQPEVVDYFIDNALWWIKETGIDGFRLDTVRHVKPEFWTAFSSAIKKDYPDFYLLGEVWSDNARYIELYHQAGIDGNTNYSLYAGIQAAFQPLSDVRTLINAIQKDQNFSRPDLNGIFIDNHDNPRFRMVSQDFGLDYMKQASLFMYTYPAIPVVYYGTEIGMEGGADPDNRRFMDWQATESSETLDYFKDLAAFKKDYVGQLQVIDHSQKHLVLETQGKSGKALVIFNTNKSPADLTFDYQEDLATPIIGQASNLSSTASGYSLRLDGISSVVIPIKP